MNRVILEGFLGSDPRIAYAKSGTCVANLSVATHEKRDGQDYTEWHRVVVFGKVAEAAAKFYRKGKQVIIEGRLQTREWVDKNKITRYTTEVLASYARLLGKNDTDKVSDETLPDEAYASMLKMAEEAKAPVTPAPYLQSYRNESETFDDRDIPF